MTDKPEIGNSLTPPDAGGPDPLVAPPAGAGRAWCCLYTRPRHEKSLGRTCAREGIRYYLPLRRAVRRYRSGRKVRWLPLFPGYLFCCPSTWEKARLRGEQNLLNVLDVQDQEELLRELREVRRALSVSADLETAPYLARGKKVRVARGPFRGRTGVVEELKSRFRVMLNVTLIGRSVPLEVDAADLEGVG